MKRARILHAEALDVGTLQSQPVVGKDVEAEQRSRSVSEPIFRAVEIIDSGYVVAEEVMESVPEEGTFSEKPVRHRIVQGGFLDSGDKLCGSLQPLGEHLTRLQTCAAK